MKKKIFLMAVPAAAAAGAAVYFRKKKTTVNKTDGKKKTVEQPGAEPALSKQMKEATYSFISGFQDAATVELSFAYDAERFSYSVCEDEFLTESGDSHVGVLHGEAFSAQFEYAGYYTGEDFEKLHRELLNKYKDLRGAAYGGNYGLRFLDGDNLCMVFPIPGDAYSYLLVTLVKAPGNDDDITEIPDYADVREILSGMEFRHE
ncbi:MAG: hypothetical protein K6C08_09710 [Oscillospiraceae bacterium]|nr:hypothetical protein [Oscillospiraceae bacterium]